MADEETRAKVIERVKAGLRVMADDTHAAGFEVFLASYEAERAKAHCQHALDAADFSLLLAFAITEGLNIVWADVEPTEQRTSEVFLVLAQAMGYEFARRMGESMKAESFANPEARIHVLAIHGHAFVQGMQQCFANAERAGLFASGRPN